MVPIFEQGFGKGFGHSLDTFLRRFISICEEHLKSGRAKSFAFILYDFHDETTKSLLKHKGIFTRLDRLSGKELSLFYIDSESKKLIKAFNDIFLGAFEINGDFHFPAVLFFNVFEGEIVDVKIKELEQSDLVFAFEEVYKILEEHIEDTKNLKSVKQVSSKKISLFFKSVNKIALEKFIEYVVTKAGEYMGKYI